MKRLKPFKLMLAGMLLSATVSAQAGTLSSSAVAPVVDNADIAMLSGTADIGGDTGHIWSNRALQGQTFTTGTSVAGYFLNAVTMQNLNNTFANNTATMGVRLGTVVGSVFTPVTGEIGSGVGYVPGDYITMTFDSAISLDPNTTYGFDWGTDGGGFVTTNNTNNASYGGGQAYSSGINNTPNDGALVLSDADRVFHLDISGEAPPPPPAEPFANGTVGINMTGRTDGGSGTGDSVLVNGGSSAGQPVGVLGTTTSWNDVHATNTLSGSDVVVGSNGETMDVSWGATGTWGATVNNTRIVAPEDPNGDMMDGHIEASGAGETFVTVSDISDNYETYDVYVYVGDDAGNRIGEIRLDGGTLQNFTSKVFDGTFTEGTDYFLFEGLSADSFTVSVEPQNDDGANRTGIRGVEIIGHVVPEPGTVGLLLLSGLFFGTRRRRA